MAVNYKELGLVNTREMFKRAVNGGYAIPAFNFNNLEQLQAIIKASAELRSPVILQVSMAFATMLTPHCCAIWHRVLLSMPRASVAAILRLLSTLTTETLSSWSRTAWTSASQA